MKMKSIFLLLVVKQFFIIAIECNKILSRNKRYLVFPEGSSLSIAICMTAQMGITPGEIFTEGVNWGISYDLPNDTRNFKEIFHKPKQVMQRRHRRDLYNKIEMILNSMGYNGRSCILRVICEVTRIFDNNKDSLLHEIIRIVFEYPISDIQQSELNNQDYNIAVYKSKSLENECHEVFPGCPFSMVDMILGYYSNHANFFK